ncbi:hypothetical protein LJC32_05030 [Oscillospiraceae bacterium OttesenSCG-928-F05]|nr:hypothetical protein [Oscillospiraceae bacterium OttesenSCG-928-F05]
MSLYTRHHRVGASQTGGDGRMKLVSAIDVMQDCSILWMESEPAFSQHLSDHNLGMFLLSRQADVLRLPRYGETVRAVTGIFRVKSYCGYRNTVLYGEDGAPCVLSWGLGAFVSYESGQMAKLPATVIASVTLDPAVDMPYLDRRIALPEGPFRPMPEVPVRRGDIDFNGHMNNARYLEAALELLPEGPPVRRFRVEYKSSAKLGGCLHPTYAETAEGAFLILADGAGKPYTVMEFTF